MLWLFFRSRGGFRGSRRRHGTPDPAGGAGLRGTLLQGERKGRKGKAGKGDTGRGGQERGKERRGGTGPLTQIPGSAPVVVRRPLHHSNECRMLPLVSYLVFAHVSSQLGIDEITLAVHCSLCAALNST